MVACIVLGRWRMVGQGVLWDAPPCTTYPPQCMPPLAPALLLCMTQVAHRPFPKSNATWTSRRLKCGVEKSHYSCWTLSNWRRITRIWKSLNIYCNLAFANWQNPKHLLKLTFRLPTVLWTLFQNISGFEWSGKRVAISGVSARSGPELSFLDVEVDTWGACPEFEQVRSQFGTARRWPLSFCKGQNNNTLNTGHSKSGLFNVWYSNV